MTRVHVLSFDLDDTLWPVAPVIRRAESEVNRWLATHHPAVAERFDADAIRAVRRSVAAAHPDRLHDLAFLRKQCLRHLFEAVGREDAVMLADAAFAVFEHWRNAVTLFADAVPALQRLGARYRLVALTNGNADLAAIGLAGCFEAIVYARDVGAAKPDRRMFDAVLARMGCPADAVVHIGDHPELDAAGARAAGQGAIWLNRFADDWPAALGSAPVTVAGLDEIDDARIEAAGV